MKKVILVLLSFVFMSALWAQAPKIFMLNKDYQKIIVKKGWKVELVQTMSYSDLELLRMNEPENALKDNRIEVYTDQDVKPSQIYFLEEGTLRLKENRHLPEGTRIVVYTAQRISRIEIREQADLKCGTFEGYETLTVAQWTRSRFEIDTIAAANLMFGFKGDSSYFHCNYMKCCQVLFDQNKGNHYGTTTISHDTVSDSNQYQVLPIERAVSRLVPQWGFAPSVRFNEDFSLHFGLNARFLFNETRNDVYNIDNQRYWEKRHNIGVSIYGKYRLSNHWDVRGGLQYDWYRTFAPVRTGVDENNILKKYYYFIDQYISVPLSVTYYPLRRREALGINFGITPSVLIHSNEVICSGNVSLGVSDNANANRFRIEVHLGLETNILGVIHGIQFYANLLPTFVGLPDANKYREFGVGISL